MDMTLLIPHAGGAAEAEGRGFGREERLCRQAGVEVALPAQSPGREEG